MWQQLPTLVSRFSGYSAQLTQRHPHAATAGTTKKAFGRGIANRPGRGLTRRAASQPGASASPHPRRSPAAPLLSAAAVAPPCAPTSPMLLPRAAQRKERSGGGAAARVPSKRRLPCQRAPQAPGPEAARALPGGPPSAAALRVAHCGIRGRPKCQTSLSKVWWYRRKPAHIGPCREMVRSRFVVQERSIFGRRGIRFVRTAARLSRASWTGGSARPTCPRQ